MKMKIADFFNANSVCSDLKGKTKSDIIAELVGILIESGGIEKKHKKHIVDVLMARETLGSTAMGQGIAIPHAKSEHVKKLIGCLGISKTGINFDSLDGEPAYIFFLLIAPLDSAGPHLKALSRISRLLKDRYFRESLRSVKDDKSIYKLVQHEDGLLIKI